MRRESVRVEGGRSGDSGRPSLLSSGRCQIGSRLVQKTAASLQDLSDPCRIDDNARGVVRSLAQLKGTTQESVKRWIQPLGLGELEAELRDHLSMAGVLQSFRQEHRLRNVKAPIVSAGDGEVRMTLLESCLGHVKGSSRLLEEGFDLVQAARIASFRMILRKDVSPFWYAS